jgi:hypothetical protein
MELIDFSQFASRRAARGQPDRDATVAMHASVGDRWTQLHTESPKREVIEGVRPDVFEADFWNDLQFRLAYPTHRLRNH